jgi:steroid 5-alpha reductase family enzyme
MKLYWWLAAILFCYVLVWFLIAVIKKRNDVADIAWGLGFVLLAWLSFYFSEQHVRGLMVNAIVTIWGVRLSGHIYRRNRGKPEDFRYHQWRMQWKNFYVRSFLQVFLLQGFFLYLIALPVIAINLSTYKGFSWTDGAGLLVWLTGFLFESVADSQLNKFKSKPENKGQILTTGLWQYSRHPNYFGEAFQWWGIFLLAVSVPFGWITVISPLVITILLRYVSGVPMLEKKYEDHVGFEAYKNKTSVFFPMPPKLRKDHNI